MPLNVKQNEKFYRNQDKIRDIVLDNARKRGHIVHGARALNKIFPPFLDTPTDDYDLFSKTPRDTARRVERRLDKKFGGDFFRVKKGESPTTHKIKSNVTNRTVADYTKPRRPIPNKKIGGVKYASVEHFKRQAKESLENPENEFRHDKDREQLTRIEVFENVKKRKLKKKRQASTFTELLPEFPRGGFF